MLEEERGGGGGGGDGAGMSEEKPKVKKEKKRKKRRRSSSSGNVDDYFFWFKRVKKISKCRFGIPVHTGGMSPPVLLALSSVGDLDRDQHVFGPTGSGYVSQRYGS